MFLTPCKIWKFQDLCNSWLLIHRQIMCVLWLQQIWSCHMPYSNWKIPLLLSQDLVDRDCTWHWGYHSKQPNLSICEPSSCLFWSCHTAIKQQHLSQKHRVLKNKSHPTHLKRLDFFNSLKGIRLLKWHPTLHLGQALSLLQVDNLHIHLLDQC